MAEQIILGILSLSLILSALRLFMGPTSQDRILALDVIAVQGSAFLVYWSMVEQVGHYIDTVLVIAAAVFLTTVLFARFLERGIR
jgi:multicomponent Na+:H+ antiporter subunit F